MVSIELCGAGNAVPTTVFWAVLEVGVWLTVLLLFALVQPSPGTCFVIGNHTFWRDVILQRGTQVSGSPCPFPQSQPASGRRQRHLCFELRWKTGRVETMAAPGKPPRGSSCRGSLGRELGLLTCAPGQSSAGKELSVVPARSRRSGGVSWETVQSCSPASLISRQDPYFVQLSIPNS